MLNVSKKPTKATARYGISGEEVPLKVFERSLNHVVERFLFDPSNPTTFEVYVRKVIWSNIRDEKRKIYGTPKKQYYQPKINTDREMRRNLISMRMKQRQCSLEAARKWVQRKQHEGWRLEEIDTMLK